jgi:phenylpyruvate tautomerase PptA (4-oxalocrotonate tautomerase family)
MPLIDFTYPAGTFGSEERTQLADGLTTALLRAERAPDTDFFRSITWAYLHELPEGTIHAAGRPVEAPTFRIEATVPQGALSDRRKQEFVAAATELVSEAAGLTEADGLRVWVLVHDVPDGNWGAAGNVVRFEQLRDAAAQEREKADQAVAEPA